jgi:hypothetical protein
VSAAPAVAISSAQEIADQSALMQSVRAFAPLLAAALVSAVAASIIAPYPVGIFHDDGVYLVLAKAIAGGSGYRYLHIPGAPFATHYPPLYPLFLALLLKVAGPFPQSMTVLLLANAALLGLVAWGSARFAIRQLGWPSAAATVFALVGALSLPLIQLTTLVMSEVMFLALLFPLLLAAEQRAAAPRDWLRDAALGAGAGALALIRAHGIVLVLALLLVFATRREWRRAAMVALGALLVLGPWQLWVALHDSTLPPALRGSYGSYLGWLFAGMSQGGVSFVARTVSRNLGECTAILADRVAPWSLGALRWIPLGFALGLLSVGATRLWRRAPVTALFLAGYVIVTLLWPYAPWRFIWGIWPLALLTAVEGAVVIVWWVPKRRTAVAVRHGLRAALLLLGLGVARAEVVAYRDRAWSEPVRNATRHIAPAMRWISQHTATRDVVVADAEPLVYLFTQRPALPPVSFTAAEYVSPRSSAADAASLRELVDHYPVRYIVTVVPSTIAAARALAVRAPNGTAKLREVDAIDGGAVFQVVRP